MTVIIAALVPLFILIAVTVKADWESRVASAAPAGQIPPVFSAPRPVRPLAMPQSDDNGAATPS